MRTVSGNQPAISASEGSGRKRDANCDKCQFLLEEYKGLRKEIEIQFVEVRSLERFTIIAVGAVWGWLSANRIEQPVPWMIPIILTIGVGIRSLVVILHFNRLNKYLRGTESAFNVVGWEHEHRKGMPLRGLRWMTVSTASLWLVLILLACLAFGYRHDFLVPPAATPTTASPNKQG